MRIVHRGVQQLHNGESAELGIATGLTNMREREQVLEVVGDPRQLGQLEPGDRVLLVDGDRTLVLRNGDVMWNDAVVLSSASAIVTVHKVGALLVVVTADGNVVMRRTATGYQRVDVARALPQVHLAAVEQQQLTATMPALEFDEPYIAWQAPLASADVQALTKLMRNAVMAIQSSAVSQGRFTGVMLARYAVRLWDDSYLWMSQPVMVGHSMIRPSYRATTTATIASNRFTGVESLNLSLDSYRLGITMATGVASEWRELVKAIDVLVSPMALPFDSATIDYRCATTTTSGTRRYLLEVGPKPRSASSMMLTMLKGDWQLVASTSTLDGSSFKAVNVAMSQQQVLPGKRCDVVTARLVMPKKVTDAECAAVMLSSTQQPVSAVTMEHNGRLYQAPSAWSVSNPWHVLPWLDGSITSGTVGATVQVTLATGEGDVTLTTTSSCPCSATAINPLVTFPDSRATHIVIAVGDRRWETDLSPLEGTGMAAWVNPTLASNLMATGQHPSGGTSTALQACDGVVVVSDVANPFVTRWRATVSGCSIMALGAACRPIYSGGFGRYPIYLFTSRGIMALPQQVSGTYGEPRLISEVVIADDACTVAGGDSLWFVTQHGILCRLSGSSVSRLLNGVDTATQMAWNDRERELWMAAPSGDVMVLMPSGRTYCRDIAVGSLYSDAQHAVAVTAQGSLLDLTTEVAAAEKSFSFMSHPFELSSLMRSTVSRVTWNMFSSPAQLASNNAAITLTLRGERGASCHGYVISRVRAAGIIAAPLSRPVVMHPSRVLRLQATGTAATGTLLLPTILTTVKKY